MIQGFEYRSLASRPQTAPTWLLYNSHRLSADPAHYTHALLPQRPLQTLFRVSIVMPCDRPSILFPVTAELHCPLLALRIARVADQRHSLVNLDHGRVQRRGQADVQVKDAGTRLVPDLEQVLQGNHLQRLYLRIARERRALNPLVIKSACFSPFLSSKALVPTVVDSRMYSGQGTSDLVSVTDCSRAHRSWSC